MKKVIILGSTGSIGTQTLEVISSRRDQFEVVGISAGGSDVGVLAQQVLDFSIPVVAIAREDTTEELQRALTVQAASRDLAAPNPVILTGPDASTKLAAMPADVVCNAITGAAGLRPTLATLAAGTTLALANKESLVIGGRLVTEAAAPGQIVAVDSEHSAFAQCLRGGGRSEVRRLILTASGGPFRGRDRASLADVSAADAMKHPTWNMGRVITINSSTLVNKGLELLEAALLYDVDLDDITVVVHPQSIVHSMVEFWDGATIAQASPPDMKLPIALGLSWPDRIPDAAVGCDWSTATQWTFEPLDNETFGAVELARRAGHAAGTAPAVFNAANESCVDAFCDGRIGFLDITDTIAAVIDEHLSGDKNDDPGARHVSNESLTLDAVLAADAWGRRRAAELCAQRTRQ
ncbi:1-deoxy-D-xylulose-5-phosphate reductoisomerase [Cutibacterium sp. WCA-380-WT-3A]|uniref:1-deoxy-D-xylulose 5-phosphate reductoisomerase n=1 Tax=Cutibacterium porci TaxID=2605781 RepID=A0A7K0J9T2_9ACTN|nr:1-deoxy-D-xylulose-5-phosphate reductoisomerase [Cutibacterium porci]MSS46508.1 1-deoxy-D-xylulose-5-phosphate reductoisomerase [Cutibacterium porci]